MLAPWKESYDKPRQSIKKQKYHFADTGLYSQSYGFSSSLYRCENWTIKKAECQRINTFEVRCWRRLLSPLDSKEIKPVIPKGNQPVYSLEGLLLKLKLQYGGCVMQRANLLGKILMLGKIEGKSRRGWQRMR